MANRLSLTEHGAASAQAMLTGSCSMTTLGPVLTICQQSQQLIITLIAARHVDLGLVNQFFLDRTQK